MISYNSDIWLQDSINHKLIMTDGTVNVNGSSYTITGASVTITNENIDFEQFELHQALCSQNQIKFGSCESSYIQFTMYENIGTVKNKTLKVYLIPNFDASLMIQLGIFKVTEDKLTADRTRREVVAHDAMFDILNSDVARWYNTVLPNSSSSMLLAQFRASFLNHFGITAVATTLVNDDIVIKRTIEPEALSGGDVIKAICEINGCFGHITNDGKFKFLYLAPDLDAGVFPADDLYPSETLYPQDINPNITVVEKSYYTKVTFEDYNSEGITQVTLRTTDEDAGVTVGTPGNPYIITGNFLVFGYNASDLSSTAYGILNKIEKCYYRPCTVEVKGNPIREVGDGIRIRTQYRGIVTYILERNLVGLQGLMDTYTSQGTQYFNQQLNSSSSQFKQLNGKVTQLKVDTDGIEGRVEDIENGTASVIQQLDNQISAKVTKTEIVGDLNREMTSDIVITPNKITFDSDGTLEINTTNLVLDQNGNATFKGNVTGATISGGTVNGTTINGANINGGIITSEDSSGNTASISAGNIVVSQIQGSQANDYVLLQSNDASILCMKRGVGTVGINGAGISGSFGNTTVSVDSSGIYVIGSGNIYINGKRVLTEDDLPSTSPVSPA